MAYPNTGMWSTVNVEIPDEMIKDNVSITVICNKLWKLLVTAGLHGQCFIETRKFRDANEQRIVDMAEAGFRVGSFELINNSELKANVIWYDSTKYHVMSTYGDLHYVVRGIPVILNGEKRVWSIIAIDCIAKKSENNEDNSTGVGIVRETAKIELMDNMSPRLIPYAISTDDTIIELLKTEQLMGECFIEHREFVDITRAMTIKVANIGFRIVDIMTNGFGESKVIVDWIGEGLYNRLTNNHLYFHMKNYGTLHYVPRVIAKSPKVQDQKLITIDCIVKKD